MGSDLPKVLVELNGKPLLLHLLDAVVAAKVDPKPIVVVAAGKRGELVRYITKDYDLEFVEQTEQLGTGHAVQVCHEATGQTEHIMVLYGDHPLLTAATIRNTATTHMQKSPTITLITSVLPDYNDWRSSFEHFGRIVRDESGNATGIVEYKDATTEQRAIKEIHPAYFCFKADWLWKNISKLNTQNVQKEYYLTDLVRMAFEHGQEIITLQIDPKESLGINSPKQLKEVEKLLDTQKE